MKKVSYKNAKARAWRQFSLYIRTRDAREYQKTHPETTDVASCFTCGKVYPIKELQAGHFIAGRTNSVLFSEDGVHSQCFHCNMGLGGNYVQYTIRMVDRYGRKFVDTLISLSRIMVKFNVDDLLEKEQYYKLKIHELQGDMVDN